MDQSPPPTSARTTSQTILSVVAVLGLLYIFLIGISGLEAGIGAFGEDFAESVFDKVNNPVAALFAAMLATALVQSSSVTTSTIVGLVGAGALSVTAAVPMIMGANIGTTITNTLVSFGHVRQGQEFRRAFSGAVVHDFFNVLTVAVALPLELTTGFLSKTATALTDLFGETGNGGGVAGESPIRTAVGLPMELLDGALADLSTAVRGTLLLVIGVVLIFVALGFITKLMRQLMAGGIERSINRILERGAGLGGMAMGMVVTMLVQSSSITTSILIPMLAAGVLTLQTAYPITLGANLGTTITAILASLAAAGPEGLTIALVHTLFNFFGILLFYPIPFMRGIPIGLAQRA
ncbi:MAG TPA: Na/Pi symporter, partial [Acidimicrobiia bacterium]|nr:Na/Pi symporter [Acidimicrobiia bacterium]